MLWVITKYWPVLLVYFVVISFVILYRYIKSKDKKGLITLQEILWSFAVLGLLLNFISLELDRLSTEKTIESYEVINRPYIYIGRIDGSADPVNNILKCRAAVVNTGSIPGWNTTIEGSVNRGGIIVESEDSFNYTALYPESVTWTRFHFPIDKEGKVDITYTINYDDYRGFKYEYVTSLYYDWESNSFTFEKCDETITKP